MASSLWRSERLLFRGVDPEDDDLLARLGEDPDAYLNASSLIPVPRNKKTTTAFREWLTGDSVFMAAIICLPPPAADEKGAADDDGQREQRARPHPTPIGFICLSREDVRFHHHQHCEIGIQIVRQHQGHGYGSEAIRWALRWGFRRANLHRIGIGAAAWNAGAVRLYERLGFTLEARRREYIFHDGGWQDLVELAMLEREWRVRYDDDDDDGVPRSSS